MLLFEKPCSEHLLNVRHPTLYIIPSRSPAVDSLLDILFFPETTFHGRMIVPTKQKLSFEMRMYVRINREATAFVLGFLSLYDFVNFA